MAKCLFSPKDILKRMVDSQKKIPFKIFLNTETT